MEMQVRKVKIMKIISHCISTDLNYADNSTDLFGDFIKFTLGLSRIKELSISKYVRNYTHSQLFKQASHWP